MTADRPSDPTYQLPPLAVDPTQRAVVPAIPVPVRPRRHGSRARGVLTRLCLTLAIGLVPVTVVTRWTDSTLLSTPGFMNAVGSLPRTPAVQAQVATQLRRPLAAAKLPEPFSALLQEGIDARVAALMNSDAFAALWRTALRTAHSQLVLILRHQSRALVLTGSTLQVDVPVTTDELLKAAGLPQSLDQRLPPAVPVRITILTNTALSQASTAVRVTDLLSAALPFTVLGLAALGLGAARRRFRAALIAASAVALTAVLAAVAVILLTHAASKTAIVAAVTTDLTRPLMHQLVIVAVAGAVVVVTLGLAAGLQAWSRTRTALG